MLIIKKNLNSIIFQRKKKKPERIKNKHVPSAPFCFPPPLSRFNDSVILCKSVTGGGSASVRIHNVPPPGQSMFHLGPFKLIWSAFQLTYLQQCQNPSCLLMAKIEANYRSLFFFREQQMHGSFLISIISMFCVEFINKYLNLNSNILFCYIINFYYKITNTLIRIYVYMYFLYIIICMANGYKYIFIFH